MKPVLLLLSLAAIWCAAPAPLSAQEGSTSAEIAELRAMVLKLQSRVEELEARAAPAPAVQTAIAKQPAEPKAPEPAPPKPSDAPLSNLLGGTSVNFLLDTYYGYNFNRPIGRDNLLRAYDVSSNNFSISQATAILENVPDPEHGKRWGARVDLQFGQATQTLQGNPNNEPRPTIYRNIFQAYGTYILPIGTGLTVDFGKWASSLGYEGNYNKDQMNYSRAYLFDFLPFYHAGARVNYRFNDKIALNYWSVNGPQQTESFNNFKDELFGLSFTPTKNVSWTVNYYLGQENPDTVYYPNGAPPNLTNAPNIQGEFFAPIPNAPKGKLHIFDSYVAWQASPKLTFALEGDYVVNRIAVTDAPVHVIGEALYTRYQFRPKVAFAAREEYLSDRGGFFSAKTQALKEATFTAEYKLAEGFLARAEYRRDWSNQPYFLTDLLGRLKKEQNTATLGLIWWFGPKTGTW